MRIAESLRPRSRSTHTLQLRRPSMQPRASAVSRRVARVQLDAKWWSSAPVIAALTYCNSYVLIAKPFQIAPISALIDAGYGRYRWRTNCVAILRESRAMRCSSIAMQCGPPGEAMATLSERFDYLRPDSEITVRDSAPLELRHAMIAIAIQSGLPVVEVRKTLCALLRKLIDPNNWSPGNVESEVTQLVEE